MQIMVQKWVNLESISSQCYCTQLWNVTYMNPNSLQEQEAEKFQQYYKH